MSAMHGGKPRCVEAAERLAPFLSNTATIHLIDPLGPATQQLDGSAWLDVIRAKPLTAINTKTILPVTIDQTLADGQDPVMVLTDQTIGIRNPRLTVISPTHGVQDVGIVTIAARTLPVAQVMVSVRNQSTADHGVLSIRSGEESVQRQIKLPPSGQTANYFIDLPSLGDTIEARLSVQDDLPADDAAWLVRGVQPMRIEIRGLVSDTLQRMVQVYSHIKPPSAVAPITVIVNRADQLSSGDAGVVVPPPDHVLAAGELRVTSDPLTKVVNWNAAIQGASVGKPPAGDWTPLGTVGNVVLLAKRESPGRQVWVGFTQEAWPKSPDFVVFWTNVLDWVAGDAMQWTAMPVQQISSTWKPIHTPPKNVQPNAWPGIYRDSATLLAMNSDVPTFSTEETLPLNLHLPPGTSNHSWSVAGYWPSPPCRTGEFSFLALQSDRCLKFGQHIHLAKAGHFSTVPIVGSLHFGAGAAGMDGDAALVGLRNRGLHVRQGIGVEHLPGLQLGQGGGAGEVAGVLILAADAHRFFRRLHLPAEKHAGFAAETDPVLTDILPRDIQSDRRRRLPAKRGIVEPGFAAVMQRFELTRPRRHRFLGPWRMHIAQADEFKIA
jgi:hypothetical protein